MANNMQPVNGQKKQKVSLKEYFRGVKTEMKKVVWPTKSELISYTAVVIVVCAFFAVIFWGIDTGVIAGLRALINL